MSSLTEPYSFESNEGRSFDLGKHSFSELRVCPVCGAVPHLGGVATCPQVKEVEFNPDGTIKRVVKK